eukprot:COSAG06_NODE_172_length_21346_cov_503.127053_9_plen_165_part_00
MAALAADTVGSLLRDRGTRSATLDALEAHAVPIERAVALGAAPALGELLALDTAEVDPAKFDRIGLLLARLAAEAPDDPAAVYAAALGEGRWVAILRSEGNTVAQVLRKPAEELTREDAQHIACAEAYWSQLGGRGFTKPFTAAGFATTMEAVGVLMANDPMQL